MITIIFFIFGFSTFTIGYLFGRRGKIGDEEIKKIKDSEVEK
jgi:hypothetical protein